MKTISPKTRNVLKWTLRIVMIVFCSYLCICSLFFYWNLDNGLAAFIFSGFGFVVVITAFITSYLTAIHYQAANVLKMGCYALVCMGCSVLIVIAATWHIGCCDPLASKIRGLWSWI